MGAWWDKLMNTGVKDNRTAEEVLADLKTGAESAERRLAQTKEAFELRKRIAAADIERQKVITQAGGGKATFSRTQMIVAFVALLVVGVIFVKACL